MYASTYKLKYNVIKSSHMASKPGEYIVY